MRHLGAFACAAPKNFDSRALMTKKHDVQIIGGGLAGCEAAWQLAQRGLAVRLSEMRGAGDMTPAHQTDGLAELVCSNSFRSDDAENNAVGLLHQEMRDLGSLIMQAAEVAKVPAGSALAVDRDVFSQTVTKHLEGNSNIEIVRERIDVIPTDRPVIIATGPLTATNLAESIWQKPAKTASLFSMQLRRLFIMTASTWTLRGMPHAGTKAMVRIT